jgi:hypothetical protein
VTFGPGPVVLSAVLSSGSCDVNFKKGENRMHKLNLAARDFERYYKSKGLAGKALWCVAMFGGNDNQIWRFTSGKGYEGIPVDRGHTRDAEERFYLYYPAMVKEHAQHPMSIQMITRATPCRRTCTDLLRKLAHHELSDHLAEILVISWEPYRGQEKGEQIESMALLNSEIKVKDYTVAIKCDISKSLTWEHMME